MDRNQLVTPSVIPGMIVRLMRVAAINLGKDPALKVALLPKIAEFRRTGDLSLFIFVADDTLGMNWLEVGFTHAVDTKYDQLIRDTIAVVRGERHDQADGESPDPGDQVPDGGAQARGGDSGNESSGVAAR